MRLPSLLAVLSPFILIIVASCSGTVERPGPTVETAVQSYSIFESDPNIYTVLFAGDLLIASRGLERIHQRGPDYPFARLSDEFNNHDFVFLNLETPITNRGAPPVDKYYLFRLDDYAALSLKRIKINAVSIANNHILDYGLEGMDDTIDYLNRNNIVYSGAGENIKMARTPAYLRVGSLDIYILSYCERPPDAFYASDEKPGTARMILSDIIEDVKKYSRRNSKVFVSLHWGIERTARPTEEQIITGRAIIDAGAEAVIGHHPHWPQGIELRGGKPIFYSLGNFYSGFGISNDMDNIMAVFHVKGRDVLRIEIVPIAGKNHQNGYQPYILKGREARAHLSYINKISAEFGTDFSVIGDRGVIIPVTEIPQRSGIESPGPVTTKKILYKNPIEGMDYSDLIKRRDAREAEGDGLENR